MLLHEVGEKSCLSYNGVLRNNFFGGAERSKRAMTLFGNQLFETENFDLFASKQK